MKSIPGSFDPDSDIARILEANKDLILTAEKQYLSFNSGYSVKIIELMVVTGIVGVMIALTKSHGIVGALIMFSSMAAFSTLLLRYSRNSGQIRFWNQAIWGIIMPITCLINDPFLIASFDHGKLISLEKSYFFGTCVVLASGFIFLMISWTCRENSPAYLNGLVAGVLFGACFLVCLLGLMALPAALFMLPALIGIVALVPWLSGVVYLRTAAMHFRMGCKKSRTSATLAAVFVVLLLATAFVSFNLMAREGHFDSFIDQILKSEEPEYSVRGVKWGQVPLCQAPVGPFRQRYLPHFTPRTV